MGFWDTVGSLVGKGIEKAYECKDRYDDSYSRSSERYSYMSDERLKREIKNLKAESGGDTFKRMGKLKAMQEEIENRHE